MYFLILDATSSKPSPDPPFLFAFLPLSLSPLVVEASPPFPCSSSPKTVPKKIDIGGAPEEIFLDDDACNSTEKADTSSIGVLQHPFGARCIVGGPGDAMLERLQRKMDYGMQALNLILVRFLQRKISNKPSLSKIN